jgi:aerobic-type carbon monoxide dehydrogenase small subunit (CoxS/CutS family)
MTERRRVQLIVNGEARAVEVEPRTLLSDVLRHDLGLTGTHVGCEHGVCGACTVIWDGAAARSCLALAPQAEGATIETIESIAKVTGDAPGPEGLHPFQQAMHELHGLQCGFCTAGIVMTIVAAERAGRSLDEALDALGGHICRCTGYVNIKAAIEHTWTGFGR